MKFRFTISRTAQAIDPFPNIDDWLSSALGYPLEVPWQDVGTANPFVAFLDSDIKTSEYLYTEYDFVAGLEYTITLEINRTEDAITPLNPRTLTLVVFDDLNDIEFSESYAASPGTASYNITFTATATCTKFGIRFTSGSARTITVLSLTPDLPESSTASYEINEPDGWKDCTLKLTRDPIFHSLVEHFDGSFIFYGDNGQVNGGYEILKAWDEDGGPDVDIDLLIEYTEDDTEFNEVFTGQLDMSLAVWMLDNKVRIPIIKDAFWATFFNRKGIPVDLMSDTDLDGMAISTPDMSSRIKLTPQKVRYHGDYNWLESVTYPAESGMFALQLDWDETVIDDLKKFELPRVPYDIGNIAGVADDLIGNFEAPWDGDYRIKVKMFYSVYTDPGDLWVANSAAFDLIIQKTNTTSITDNLKATKTTVSVGGGESYGIAELDKTIKLYKGEQVAIFVYRGATFYNFTIFGENRISWLPDVDLATKGTIVLSGEQAIDGVMTSTSRVLVKDQGNAWDNGIWISAAGAWTRASDADSTSELENSAVYVIGGDTQAGSAWRQTEIDFVLGTDSNRWVYIIPSDERFRPFPDTVPVEGNLEITADTTFRETIHDGFLIHDAGAAILARLGLGSQNPFYSNTFGSDKTLYRQY